MPRELADDLPWLRASMARLVVRRPNGDEDVGSAFHIGDGFYATARHVLENNELLEFKPEGDLSLDLAGAGKQFASRVPKITRVVYPTDSKIDLAVVETTYVPVAPAVRIDGMYHSRDNSQAQVIIGGHLDDWFGDDFTLWPVLVLGYVPVPQDTAVRLLVLQTHVSSVVDTYSTPHPQFVLASVPRGGFSGGPVVASGGYLIGVMTGSLHEGEKPYELGFAAAVSVEPLLSLLSANGIYPGRNADTVRVLIEGSDEWEATITRELGERSRCPSCLLRFRSVVNLPSKDDAVNRSVGVFHRASRMAPDVHPYWLELLDGASDYALGCPSRRSVRSIALRLGRAMKRWWRVSM